MVATAAEKRLLIGGEWVETGSWHEVRSPYSGELVARVAKAGADDARRAVDAAEHAMRDPLPAHKRAEILVRVAGHLGRRHEEVAQTICAEAGKPLKAARVEVSRAMSTFTIAAVEARKLAGEMVPMDASQAGAGKLAFTLRLPVGIVGAISPFNFPLNLVAHKVAPAIAAGCPVVLKPASSTPLTALALADLLLDECGLPDGWLNVVTCPGSVANHLVEHPDVAMITFTGSPEVGWGIRAQAPRKKVSLELGNNSPVIIEPDGDWRTAADKIGVAGYSHAGQSCISTQRVYVHESIAEDFTGALVERVGRLTLGAPLDEDTDVSSLISSDDRDRVADWIGEAVDGGASVAAGGTVRDDGRLLEPTVLTGVQPDMKVSADEVFGPVVGVQSYRSVDDALELANRSRYGLQAAIYTADLGLALRAARELRYGGVLVNEVPTWRADQMPYGGVGDSGNTREGPAYAVHEMTEARLVVIQP